MNINTLEKNSQFEEIYQTLKEYLPQLKEEYQIKQLGIFGSYVRGEQTKNSDLDLLIEFNPEARFGLITFCQLENKLSEKLGKKVDLVMKNSLKPYLGKNILKEVVYL